MAEFPEDNHLFHLKNDYILHIIILINFDFWKRVLYADIRSMFSDHIVTERFGGGRQKR